MEWILDIIYLNIEMTKMFNCSIWYCNKLLENIKNRSPSKSCGFLLVRRLPP